MSDLLAAFRQEIGKNSKLGQESKPMPSYRTGIDVLDYRNGKYDEDGEIKVGIDGGKILYLVGKSGTGKSTKAVQIATTIADQFEESQVIHMDPERASDIPRILGVSGWSKKRYASKYIHMNQNITTESVYATLKSFAELKKSRRAELEYNTGKKDVHGNDVMALPPTIFILDSLAVLTPENLEEEKEMSGSMSASAIAKANTVLFKRIMGALVDANIIFIVINHINAKIDINPMAKTQAQVNFLKQDETLPGGNAAIYLSNYLIKLVSAKKLTPDKEYGIKGFRVIGELIKSRSAAAGLTYDSVYEQQTGFSNVLSNYELLKASDKIGGSGRGFYLKGLDDIKFSQKTIIEKYESDEKFRAEFDRLSEECLTAFIPQPKFLAYGGNEVELDEDTLEYSEEDDLFFNPADGKYYEKNLNGNFEEVEVEEG
jgi:RecA/RadA recombinase